MRRLIKPVLIILIAASIPIAVLSQDDPIRERRDIWIERYLNSMQKSDPDRQFAPLLGNLSDGSCDIEAALKALTENNEERFRESLLTARDSYINSREGIKDLLGMTTELDKPIPQTPLAPVVDPRFRDLDDLRDIVNRMAALADVSIQIIDSILDGVATEADFHQLFRNSTDIMLYAATFVSVAAWDD